uniref:Ribosomal protein L14 n=1 Tax=Stachyamoeba lipophora TaxID=463046 RepID=A0A0B5GSJ9_STALP|nr:ribosomal protein L14 [Stachyamoeba lipophora]AJF22930.1 ribosomal protein L14 [Stachyamoeba lipophora]
MVQMKTRLHVSDNAGALIAECIKVLRKKKNPGSVGDTIVVAIKRAYPKKKVKTHDVHRGVIVKTKKKILRNQSGISVSFSKNSVVILDKKNNPLGNRIKGSVCKELRKKKFMKIISMASSIL